MKKYFSSYWIRSAFYSFLQRFSITLFGFFNLVLLLRTLPPSKMGTWALFLTLTTIFELTKSNLLKNAHVLYVSSNDDEQTKVAVASSSFLINLSISILFILLILFFSDWLSHWLNMGEELARMLKWFIPGMIFMVLFSHLEAIQQSFLDFKGIFAGYFIRQIAFFSVLLAYKLTKTPISLESLAIYQSGSIALGVIVLFWLSRKYLHFRFTPTMPWIRKIFGYGGYIFGSGLVSNIASNIDQLLTGKFISPSALAYYNVASRINGLVDIPSYAAADIIFPKASRASVTEGVEKVKYLFERMVGILTAFNLPTVLFIVLFPKLVTYIVAGPQYTATVLVLQLYMITGIFRPFQNQSANLLNSIGKPGLTLVLNTLTLATYLGLNYLCLMKIGFYGAAIGTLITYLIFVVVWYFVMRRQIGLSLKNIITYTIDAYKRVYQEIIKLTSKSRREPTLPS